MQRQKMGRAHSLWPQKREILSVYRSLSILFYLRLLRSFFQILLNNGADVNAGDSKGETSLHKAGIRDDFSLVEVMICLSSLV